ncbi:PHB depolymerase family esterase [uncultured Chitinophaga sp.]|jgi:Poly(3-hydroxybutyrate) depolymerase|uniref:alpha/beta hydrolase family esterase n=1 Tax=uncultured Chitinophaga sp. TaxID=339340 RepID=UPI00262A78EB|nr:PHB depolymerase family esterase [uncultured Chitinophaga sp.]
MATLFSSKRPKLNGKITTAAISHGDQVRKYRVYVPPALKENAALIVALHGSKTNGQTLRKYTGYELDELADHLGYLVIYPDGYKNTWNDCRADSPFPAHKANIDDVGFIKKLVDTAHRQYRIDTSKVFAFGFSNGGGMALRCAMEDNFINTACVVSANLPTLETCSCPVHGHPVKVMLVSGTKDPIIPYQGGMVTFLGKKIGTVMSAYETAKVLADRCGAALVQKNEQIADNVECLSWLKDSSPVVKLYTIHEGGHTIPQSRFRFFSLITGKTVKNFDTPKAAIEFFGLLN